MEEKYGKLENQLKMMPMVCIGQFLVGFFLVVGGVIALRSAIVGGSSLIPSIILLVAGVLFIAYCVRLIVYCRIALHEKAIVIYSMFNVQEIPLDTIFAIYWDFPGQNTVNSRGPNKNVTTAEILLEGGHLAYRATSGIYRDMEKLLGDYQAEHGIQKDLEKKNSGRHNYS